MAGAMEDEGGEVSLILLNCDGQPLYSGADTTQHIVVDRISLPFEMQQFPAAELALQQIIGLPEGNFTVVHVPQPIQEVVQNTNEEFENDAAGEPDQSEESRDDCILPSSVDWSHKMTLLLLDSYRIHFDEFNDGKVRKKTVWEQIASSLEQSGYGNLTWRACAKKFYNLRGTYQSMTDGHRKLGCKKWPYYDLFCNLFEVPSSNLDTQQDEDLVQVQLIKGQKMMQNDAESRNISNFSNERGQSVQSSSLKNTEIQPAINWSSKIILEQPPVDIHSLVNANDDARDQVLKNEISDDKSSTSSVEWTHNLTMLLLELYQAHVDDFKNDRIRKKTVWARIASGIQSAGYAGITWEACDKKFRNLKCTYRTIIENKKNENVHTKWPYYDIFHELFGLSETKLLLEAMVKEQNGQHDESGLELECCSVTFSGGDLDLNNGGETVGNGRKRKILTLRPLSKDFVAKFSKVEDAGSVFDRNENVKSREFTSELENEGIGSSVEWTRDVTQLLLASYQRRVGDFENGTMMKKTVWGRIASDLQGEGCGNMTWDVCEKKFRNLKSTYRTIVENSRATGNVCTKWPYFDYFHNLFGKSSERGIEVDALLIKPELGRNDSGFHNEGSITTEPEHGKGISRIVRTSENEHAYWLSDIMTETQKKCVDIQVLGNKKNESADIDGAEIGNTRLSFEWTHDITLSLLDLYRIHLDDFKSGSVLKKNLWMQIASSLQSAHLVNGISWDMCEKKFRNLKCIYLSIIEQNKRTGRERKKWPYYAQFEQFFGSSTRPQKCDSEDGSAECLEGLQDQPPQWFVSFMNEVQIAEENRFSFLKQMHAEQKQQNAEHIATLNELNSTVRQLVDRLASTVT